MPVEIRPEERTDAPDGHAISGPYLDVCALRELLAFFNRLFLLGSQEDAPTHLSGCRQVEHSAQKPGIEARTKWLTL